MERPDSVRQRLYKYMGDAVDAFLLRAEARLETYTNRWRLSNMRFMPTDTVNLLFACESGLYGDCVLKLCIPGPEVATEAGCLRAYDGRGYCKLWDYDLSEDVLLLERITPGDCMWVVADYRERARLMAMTVKDLPVAHTGLETYPTYGLWLNGVRQTLMDRGGLEELLFYIDEALAVYGALKQRHPCVRLLHGDLHQENLLRNAAGGYTIIDPKGVMDAPVMETARFLLNETPCDKEKIREMVAIMAPILGISMADMLRSMFIDAALGNGWALEEYFSTNEDFEERKGRALETCGFVYGLSGH